MTALKTQTKKNLLYNEEPLTIEKILHSNGVVFPPILLEFFKTQFELRKQTRRIGRYSDLFKQFTFWVQIFIACEVKYLKCLQEEYYL